MPTPDKNKAALEGLIAKANAATGGNDTTVTDAVDTLIAGFGQGGGDDFVGIKYSDFDSYRGSPRVADARSLPDPGEWNFGGYDFLFANAGPNPNNGWNTLLREVYLPKIEQIYGDMFRNCGSLTTIHADFTTITAIRGSGFYNCDDLTEFPYMPNLTVIEANAFYGCKGLTEIRLYNTLTTFPLNAFNQCTNITDIYVPWAEGAVANAPWGATNATIHYNTVYDENHDPIE